MTTLKWVTFAVDPDWLAPEYPTIALRNCNGKYLLLIAKDHFNLYRVLPDGSIEFIRALRIAARQEPRWDLKLANILYYHTSSQIISLNVDTQEEIVKFTSTDYVALDGMGESDICEDGHNFVFSGSKRDSGIEVFTYSLKNGRGPGFVPPPLLRSLYITPSFIICGTLNGVFLFSHSGTPYGQIIAGQVPHMDVSGDNLIYCSSNDPVVGKNAVVLMDLHNPETSRRVLLDLPQKNWGYALHISAGINGCGVSTYSFLDPTLTPELWYVPYDQTKASARVVCQIPTIIHGDDIRKYLGEPKAVLSWPYVYMSVDDGLSVNTSMVNLMDNKDSEIVVTPTPLFPGYKEIDFTKDEGREWLWYFKVINGKMTVKVFDKA